jgi:hypothetical protein
MFRDALRRDRACIVTQHILESLLVASHLIPRRIGDAGVQSVLQRFTGPSTPVDSYDPTIGVLLFTALDALTDGYELGFWNGPVSPLPFILYRVNILCTGMAGPAQFCQHASEPLWWNAILE